MSVQLSKQQQQYLILGILWIAGGGFVYVKYFWLPISDRIAKTGKEIEDVAGKTAKAKGQAIRLDKIKNEIAVLNDKAVEAEKRLPKTRDLPAVIDTLNALAKRYNVQLKSFAPAATADKQYFTEVPYAVSMGATYHDAARFFAALALEERIFNVRGVTFAGTGDTLTVNFQLIAYQYKG
jgi:Tfp pilus assembly protein PilO